MDPKKKQVLGGCTVVQNVSVGLDLDDARKARHESGGQVTPWNAHNQGSALGWDETGIPVPGSEIPGWDRDEFPIPSRCRPLPTTGVGMKEVGEMDF